MSLQEICRVAIRRILRRNIQIEHPSASAAAVPKRRSQSRRRGCRANKRRRVNLVPMQTGMMIVRPFHIPYSDSDDDDEEADGERVNRNANDRTNLHLTDRRVLDDDSDDRTSDDDSTDIPDEFPVRMPDSRNFLGRLFWPSRNMAGARNALARELGFDLNDNTSEEEEENEVMGGDVECNDATEESDANNSVAMQEVCNSNATSAAIVIGKTRSNNGYSASFSSSGIGTCSSLGAESESSGHAVDMTSRDDVFRPGTCGSTRSGLSNDESLDFEHDLSEGVVPCVVGNPSGTFDEQFADKLADVVEVQEDTISDIDSSLVEAIDDDVAPRVSFKHLMHEKVNSLPIPSALKDFLLYYREL